MLVWYLRWPPWLIGGVCGCGRVLQWLRLGGLGAEPSSRTCSLSPRGCSPVGRVFSCGIGVVVTVNCAQLACGWSAVPGAPSITWRCGFGILVGGVGVCARGWARREDVGLDTLSELNESVGHLVRVRVSGLSKTASVGCRSVFLDPDVGEDLGHLRGGCVVVSAGGASGGIIFACMQCCIHCCKTGSVCWTMLVVLLVPATRCWPVVSQCLPSLSQRLGSRVAQVSIRPGRDMLLVLRGVQQDRCPSSWPPCLQPLGTVLEFVMAERQYDV